MFEARRLRLIKFCVLAFMIAAGPSHAHKAHQESKPVAVTEAFEATTSVPESAAPEEAVVATMERGSTASDLSAPESTLHSGHHADEVEHPLDAESPASSWVRLVPTLLGRLHPMLIHFPIALFLSAFVAEIFYLTTRSELFRHTARFCVWGGFLGALAAVPMGWLFAATGETETGWLLEAHRWAGTSVLVLGSLVLWAGERNEAGTGARPVFQALLTLQAMLVAGTGFLGGSLLYGIDHLWRGIG